MFGVPGARVSYFASGTAWLSTSDNVLWAKLGREREGERRQQARAQCSSLALHHLAGMLSPVYLADSPKVAHGTKLRLNTFGRAVTHCK